MLDGHFDTQYLFRCIEVTVTSWLVQLTFTSLVVLPGSKTMTYLNGRTSVLHKLDLYVTS
jgi:hypothetical protein